MKNKNAKDFFSFGLYKEALRRVKLPGIIFFVILALEALIIPLGTAIDSYSHTSPVSIRTVTSVNALNAHPLIVLSFIVITPVFTWTLFSFLNKRNASDYYHSLPHTRVSLFISTVAALVTWVLGIIVSTSLLSIIGHLLFPKLFSVAISSYVSTMIGCFAASLLVASAIIIATSTTGTILNTTT